jgi:ABC-type polysaccharide/polyol phosphate transport system ATPase subunit
MKSYTLGMKKQINVTDYLYTMDQMQILRTISDKCVPVADLYFQEKCKRYVTYLMNKSTYILAQSVEVVLTTGDG